MKRVMKHAQIYCGVQIENDSVKFNWSEDSALDLLQICKDTSAEFNEDDIRYIYGYSYTSNANSTDKRKFRNYVKGLDGQSGLYSEDVQEFVDRGILRIENYCKFSDFGATVTIDSTKSDYSLVDIIDNQLSEYLDGSYIPFRLIKQTYDNVEFDANKATSSMHAAGKSEAYIQKEIKFTLQKFEELKSSGELFQMKRFMPKELRAGFSHYLKFRNEEEKEIYMSLQGINVLIFDDFMTSGATIKEIIRYLKSINDKNTLTVFVLIKQ